MAQALRGEVVARPRPEAGAPPRIAASAARVPQLPALTGLRFVAALGIVVFHFGAVQVTAPVGLLAVVQQLAQRVAAYGLIGVNCFFILSGFVLAYTYIDRTGRRRGSPRTFWVARLARIYPAYLVGMGLACGPLLWYHDAPTQRLLRLAFVPVLTLMQAWVPALANTWNPPGWSLSAEAFFYLVFPLLAVPLGRLGRPRLCALLAALWAALLLAPVALLLLVPPAARAPGSYWEQIVSYEPLLRLPEFLLGVTLGRLFVLSPTPLPRARAAPLAAAAAGALALALLVAPHLPFLLVHLGLFDPLFAALIYGLACQRGRLSALLSRPAMLLLGEASYGIYILHAPIWAWLTHLTGRPPAALALPYFLAYVVLLSALAVLSLRFVETPARRLIRRRFAAGA